MHPNLGAFLVEVKGWSIDFIAGVEAGTIHLQSGETSHPWQQAQGAAAQLQAGTRLAVQRRRLPDTQVPFFDWVVAMPSISRQQWNARGFSPCLNSCELLFADDLVIPVALRHRLLQYIRQKARRHLNYTAEQLNHVREALGSSYVIQGRNRQDLALPPPTPGTVGEHIHLAQTVSQPLSSEQVKLIEAEFDGRPQLIRGVAGSGKTVVLVRNCARLVDRLERAAPTLLTTSTAQPRVAIVCFNRALAPFLKQQFSTAYRDLTHRDQPAAQVDICHFNVLMYSLSKAEGGPLRYLSVHGTAPDHQLRLAKDYLRQVETLAADAPQLLGPLQFDAIYVDEGQDLYDDEYRVLMLLLRTNAKTGGKNIVIAYDDAQNLYGRPRPTWIDLGIEVRGRSYPMRTCFRNTRQIVEFGLNVLLGSAAEKRAATRAFADTAWLKENQLVTEQPDRWLIHFAPRSSAVLPHVQLFETRAAELAWVLAQAHTLLELQQVRPEDILLLFQGNDVAVCEFAPFATTLRQLPGVQDVVRLWGSNKSPDGRTPVKDSCIFQQHCITLGTVKSAKGYDAPIVFLLGADLFSVALEDRAAFYVAATRAKAHLYVTGTAGAGTLSTEAQAVSHLLATPLIAFQASGDPSL